MQKKIFFDFLKKKMLEEIFWIFLNFIFDIFLHRKEKANNKHKQLDHPMGIWI